MSEGTTVSNDVWNNNEVQFARLLAEIVATQDNIDFETLATSMDLELEQVQELLERASDRWEQAKEEYAPVTPRS